MKFTPKQHRAELMFPVLLLITFAMFSVMLAGVGAAVYRHSAEQLNENYTSRTAVAYISEKLRQHNRNGAISFTELEGIPAIALQSVVISKDDGQEARYVTYIYFWNEALRELFVREGTEATAAMGSAVVELSGFSFAQTGQLLQVTAVSPNGESHSVLLNYLHGG